MATFVYNTGNAKAAIDELHLEFGMFFDGTLNNKRNTELREKYRDGANHIEDGDDQETVLRKEEAIKETRKKQEKEYSKLKNKDISEDDSEYERYLKSAHQGWLDKKGVDNSFSNDNTNVARMWKCCDEVYATYVEGIGTLDNSRDVDDGFQYGSGFTGVRGKVRRGCELLADKIDYAKNKEKQNKGKKLSQITIDISGFSRGAAAARNFVYEVNCKNKRPQDVATKTKRVKDGYTIENISPNYGNDFQTQRMVPVYKTIYLDKDKIEVDPKYLDNDKMPKFGFLGYYLLSKGILSPQELEDLTLNIRFIGVYETVSSYEEFGDMGAPKRVGVKGAVHSIRGSQYYFGNDVEQLQLNNLGGYAEAVHFTAMDEHRENFDLTRFPGSTEKNFPGVHCDIGGAYITGTEIVDEIETSNHKPLWFLNNLRQHLINEHWYKDEQIVINNKFLNAITFGSYYRKITGTRFLKKEYSYIPLHFMEGYCLKHMKDNMIEGAYPTTSYPIDDHVLSSAKNYLQGYLDGEVPEWNFVSDEILAQRRRAKEERERLEKELEEMRNGKMPSQKPVYDNLDPKIYLPTPVPVLEKLPVASAPGITIDENGNKIQTLEEVTVIGYNEQSLLRKIRNEYLHWSANRDWLGMDPAKNYERIKH